MHFICNFSTCMISFWAKRCQLGFMSVSSTQLHRLGASFGGNKETQDRKGTPILSMSHVFTNHVNPCLHDYISFMYILAWFHIIVMKPNHIQKGPWSLALRRLQFKSYSDQSSLLSDHIDWMAAGFTFTSRGLQTCAHRPKPRILYQSIHNSLPFLFLFDMSGC